MKFKENFALFSKAREKKLINSIKLAKRIFQGKITYEESDQVDDKKRDTTSSRRRNPNLSSRQMDEEDEEWNSSTETSSNLPQSEHHSVISDSEEPKVKKKRGRRLREQDAVRQSFLDSNLSPRLPEQSSSRRKIINSQDHQFSPKQFEIDDIRPRKNFKRHSILRLDSLSPTNSNLQMNKDQELSNAVSETQSMKNDHLMSLENDHSVIECKPSAENKPGNESLAISKNPSVSMSTFDIKPCLNTDKMIAEEDEESNYNSIFQKKSSGLQKKIESLETQLALYISSPTTTSGISISQTIHECLTYLSVEALSSEELLSYLQNDMGKLLYALVAILEEFERHALEQNILVHQSIKHKREKVSNLLSTLKIRMISNFLEQQDFVKLFTEDLRDMLKDKIEQEKIHKIEQEKRQRDELERQRKEEDEKKRIEEQKRLEELNRMEEISRIEELRRAEERRRIEEQTRLEEQTRIEEQRRKEEQRRIEEQRRAEEQRRIEEQKREEEQKWKEEQKKKEEIEKLRQEEKRLREEKLRQEEEKRLREEKLRQEEEKRLKEEKLRQEEKRLREEKLKRDEEEARRKEEELRYQEEEKKRKQAELRLQEEEKIRIEEEKRREERIKAEEERIKAEEELIQKKKEEEKKKIEEEKARIDKQKKDKELAELNYNLQKAMHSEIYSFKIDRIERESSLIQDSFMIAMKTQPLINNIEEHHQIVLNKSHSNKLNETIKIKKEFDFDENAPNGIKLTRKHSSSSNLDHNKQPDVLAKLQKNTLAYESAKNVRNPALRKKICQLLAKCLEESGSLKTDIAQDKTMIIENKIRICHPEMKEEYRKRCSLVMQLIKLQLIDLDEVAGNNDIDWLFLKSKLEKYSNQKNKRSKDKSMLHRELSPKA